MVEQGFSTVEFWLASLGERTRPVSRYHLERFLTWVRVNGGDFANCRPDQLVDYQVNAAGRDRFRILDLIKGFIATVKGRYGYKVKTYSSIRSFFMHNRADLPRDSTLLIRGDTPKVRGDLKPEEIRQIVLSANECYRAAFLCMIQGGMDRESFTHWNLNGLERLKADLKADLEAVRVDLPGRKKSKNERPYYTFVGTDAIEALRKWIALRPQDATAIFTDQLGNPVSSHALKQYWDRKLVRLGMIPKTRYVTRKKCPRCGEWLKLDTDARNVIYYRCDRDSSWFSLDLKQSWDTFPGERDPERERVKKSKGSGIRYGKNPHEMRDVFRSLWEKSPAKPSVAEFLMGHEVDPLEYNKAFQDESWVRKEYSKALPFLQIISSGRPFGQVEEDEVEALKTQVQELQTQKDNRIEDLEIKVKELTSMLRLLYENPHIVEDLKKG